MSAKLVATRRLFIADKNLTGVQEKRRTGDLWVSFKKTPDLLAS
jgi:hypothetical protein